MRQIVLDTETTGLDPEQGHRIIEIGCIELIDRELSGNNFHRYVNPQRDISHGAQAVHGLNAAFLADKPAFASIANELLNYLGNSELIIHNAPFDLGFLDCEFGLLNRRHKPISQQASIIDTLLLARQLHPGQKNNLDALCRRYEIDNTNRELHGALLDAQLLAQVYLRMTGGQGSLFGEESNATDTSGAKKNAIKINRLNDKINVIYATNEELMAHQTYFDSELF